MFKKVLLVLMAFIFSFSFSRAFADESSGSPGAFIFRWGYMEGIGGQKVGDKGAFAGGIEYQFFRRSNQTFSISFDEMIDRTARLVNRPVTPLILNYRLYTGSVPFTGFYLSGGAGIAMPWWDWHGGGMVAWQGSIGYAASGGGFLEFRYVGRPKETVIRAGNPFVLNNTFFGAETGYNF